ncbi:extracellular solute-binding protein [Terrirubrum flagellatum]|uniref:extracellular solute-binding protein n=1 Tax=Terrirubrum flagellatum TaxID=2895980 RepID=UPI003CC8250A
MNRTRPSRRAVIAGGLSLAAAPALDAFGGWGRALAEGETESHGLSLFGDLALPADFKHFRYVNPDAPKAGTLRIQIKQTSGNQNFDTFNTLNHLVLKGDGAAGMDAIYDTLMSGTSDEPSTQYGLVARAVRVSADKLTYRFLLRPEARFHDGSKLTAKDVAFSLNTLKAKGHPSYRVMLKEVASAEAESDEVALIKLTPNRSRELHLIVAGLPIFSEAWWKNRDFEAATLDPPLGSGAYKVGKFEQGRFIEFERVPDYWGKDLPVNVGQNNFARIRYEYFRDRQVAFEAFKSGVMNYNQEFTSRFWHTLYDFPAIKEGRVKTEELETGLPATAQGWWFNQRRGPFKDIRIRKALALCFDFEWTNKNIMFSSFRRTTSFFDNSDYKATGKPSPEELKLLEPFRDKLPPETFDEVWVPPVSDGSGSDRNLLRQADQLLRDAGCKREGNALLLPNGKPFKIEFLDFQASLQPHTQPYQANLKRLGIDATSRIIDAAQYESRMKDFDFDMASRNMSNSLIPSDTLRIIYGSESGKHSGGRNMGGIDSPAVDALIDIIGRAQSIGEITTATRALDRVLRSGQYWVPMWYLGKEWVAYWDAFSRPATKPKYGSGAPSLWWWDEAKAKKSGTQG